MSGVIELTLDTTGPEITWGSLTSATPGGTLVVEYESDEPVASATLHLANGQTLPLTVTPDVLSASLPTDVATGSADVTVTDDVGNAQRYPAVVIIAGGQVLPAVGGGPIPWAWC